MTDGQKKVFVWTLAVLTVILVFFAAGCAPTAGQVKLIQSDVAALTSIAKIAGPRTPDEVQRIGYHSQRIQDEVEKLR